MEALKKKDARIEFRIPRKLKEIIECAAETKGLSLSSFAISTLVEEAAKVTENADRISLGNRDRDIFLAALDKGPSKALKKAFRKYRSQKAQTDGK